MKISVIYFGVLAALFHESQQAGDENSVCKLVDPLNVGKAGFMAMKANMPFSPQCFFKSFFNGIFAGAGMPVPNEQLDKILLGARGVCQIGEAVSGLSDFITCALDNAGSVRDIARVNCLVFLKAIKCVPAFVMSLREMAKSMPELAQMVTG